MHWGPNTTWSSKSIQNWGISRTVKTLLSSKTTRFQFREWSHLELGRSVVLAHVAESKSNQINNKIMKWLTMIFRWRSIKMYIVVYPGISYDWNRHTVYPLSTIHLQRSLADFVPPPKKSNKNNRERKKNYFHVRLRKDSVECLTKTITNKHSTRQQLCKWMRKRTQEYNQENNNRSVSMEKKLTANRKMKRKKRLTKPNGNHFFVCIWADSGFFIFSLCFSICRHIGKSTHEYPYKFCQLTLLRMHKFSLWLCS